MKHTKNQQIKNAYQAYLKSHLYCLSDAYGRYSDAKRQAWHYCYDLMNKYHGYKIRILGANTCTFSAGFIGEVNGVPAFIYITKAYDRYILLDEIEE